MAGQFRLVLLYRSTIRRASVDLSRPAVLITCFRFM